MGRVKNMLRRLLRRPADALVYSSKALDKIIEARVRQILDSKAGASTDSRLKAEVINNPHLAAKYYPHEADRTSYLLRSANRDAALQSVDLPVPPPELRVHGGNEDLYRSLGPKYVSTMRSILAKDGFALPSRGRVLDFGCGDAMMIRAFHDVARSSEVWGVDIRATHIIWCQQNLSPPFKFVTTTSFPSLPFEDSYFDLVYAGSVFTHIDDLAEAWLLELKRIVRPGGRLYLTVHDRHTIEIIYETRHSLHSVLAAFEAENDFRNTDFEMFSIGRTPGAGDKQGQVQVFYDIDYLVQHWANYMKVVSVTPDAYGYQTAVVLEKV